MSYLEHDQKTWAFDEARLWHLHNRRGNVGWQRRRLRDAKEKDFNGFRVCTAEHVWLPSPSPWPPSSPTRGAEGGTIYLDVPQGFLPLPLPHGERKGERGDWRERTLAPLTAGLQSFFLVNSGEVKEE